jgi:hypothetical protein
LFRKELRHVEDSTRRCGDCRRCFHRPGRLRDGRRLDAALGFGLVLARCAFPDDRRALSLCRRTRPASRGRRPQAAGSSDPSPPSAPAIAGWAETGRHWPGRRRLRVPPQGLVRVEPAARTTDGGDLVLSLTSQHLTGWATRGSTHHIATLARSASSNQCGADLFRLSLWGRARHETVAVSPFPRRLQLTIRK